MRSILCYGDSNTWGAVPMTALDDAGRYGPAERWPGVMREALGDGHLVIEEGLSGRTTVFDDPIEGAHKNGRAYLTPCLETHLPLDLVIIMLGTNDLKKRFSAPAFDIARGAGVLVGIVRTTDFGKTWKNPEVLLVCPPPLARLELLSDMFEGAQEESRKLPAHYRDVARTQGCRFLDAGEVIASSDVDGIHLDADAHRALGHAIAAQVASHFKSS